MVKTFEVYAYLDPRCSDNFIYGDVSFDFKPVYIGRGCVQHKRKYTHLKKSSNIHLSHLINKLKQQQLEPVILTLYENLTFEESVKLEMMLINLIGRADLNQGPLYNFCDGGGGVLGIKLSDEQRQKRSDTLSAYFANMTQEQRKKHGVKSKHGRTVEGEYIKKAKFRQYWDNLSPEAKQNKENKRYNAWCKTYYNRSSEQLLLTQSKCSKASYKKPQYFVKIYDCLLGSEQSKFLIEWTIGNGFSRDGIMDRIRSNDFTSPINMRKVKKQIIIRGAEKRKPTLQEYQNILSIL